MTTTAEFEYSFRLGLFGRERNYRLAPNLLEWNGKTRGGKLRYADIRKVRIYRVHAVPLFRRRRSPAWRCARLFWLPIITRVLRSVRIGANPSCGS